MITPYLRPVVPKEVEDQIYLLNDEEFLNSFVDSSCAIGMLDDANKQKLSECICSLVPEYTSEERDHLLQNIGMLVQSLALTNSSLMSSYKKDCNMPEEVLRSIVLASIRNIILSYVGNSLTEKYMKQKMNKDLGRRYFELTYDFPDFLRKCRIYEDLYVDGKLDYIPHYHFAITPMIFTHSLHPEFWNLIYFCLQESMAMHIRRHLDYDDSVSFRKIFKMHWSSNESHKNSIKSKYKQLCGYYEDPQNCNSSKEWDPPEDSLIDRVKTWIDGRIAHTDLKHIRVNPKVIEDIMTLAEGLQNILNEISDLYDLQVEYQMPDKYSDTKELLCGLTYLFIEKYSLDAITIGKEKNSITSRCKT